MSGNQNSTIAHPGHDWQMLWPGTFDDFQLDIVGFLAILGEGSVTHNAQVAALSRLFYLPRLIPAPQALLWPNRPTTLPPTKATVTAVHSGNTKDHIHHVAHVLLGDVTYKHESKPLTVRCVSVTKKIGDNRGGTLARASLSDRLFRGLSKMAGDANRPTVKARAAGPLSWVTVLGFSMALSLFILSIIFGDGMSLIATLMLSLLSTLVGIGNKWELELPKPRQGGTAPPAGDVVIRYPNGSFLVVKCKEDVARELYFAPEEIVYNIKSPATYRVISLIGTMMLMLGVICLANARLQLQFAWAAAYILINAAQWIAAALPSRSHWDLDCYEVVEEGLADGPTNQNFTQALWKAILLTQSTEWVERGEAAPRTKTWEDWLKIANDHAQEAESDFGELIDPNKGWKPGNYDKAAIWRLPKERQWDPNSAWDELNQKNKKAQPEGTNTIQERPKECV